MNSIRATISRKNPTIAAVGSVLLGLAMLKISSDSVRSDPWKSDLFLNLGSSFVFAFFAITVIDFFVRQHDHRMQVEERERHEEELRQKVEEERRREEQRWQPVREHIDHYVLNVARRCALAYRIGVGIGDNELPHDQLRAEGIDGLRGVQEWIQDTIVPKLSHLRKVDRGRWILVMEILEQANQDAERLIRLFGDRLRPETYSKIIDVQREIDRARNSYFDLASPFLGVPDSDVIITDSDHSSESFLKGVLTHEMHPIDVVRMIRRNFEDQAIDEAENVLYRSIELIEVVIPYFSSERTPSP